jgi:hypothetical protein
MTTPIWRLNGHMAKLAHPQLRGLLDLARSQRGLHELEVSGIRFEGTGLLGVGISGDSLDASAAPSECHARATDLVAVYRAAPERPFEVELRWRICPLHQPAAPLPAMELILSVRTELPRHQPELATQSVLAGGEALGLLSGEEDAFAPLVPAAGAPVRFDPLSGRPCWLLRPVEAPWSYAEMLRPSELKHGELGLLSDVEGERDRRGQFFRLRQRLFVGELEKGVLVRCRVRGMFLPRQDDARRAAAAFAAFVAEEPVLS